MKERTKVNIILLVMLALHCLWLYARTFMGNVANQHTPTALYGFVIGIGVLIILAPYAIDWVKSFYKRKWSFPYLTYKKWRILLILGIPLLFVLNLIMISFIYLGSDEQGFLEGVQILVSRGSQYFFDHYTEIPWLGRQHPPLPILMIGYPAKILGTNVVITSRVLSSLLGLGTLICTYFIGKKLYNHTTGIYGALFLLGIQKFYLLNLRGNNDIFITFFFVLSLLLLLQINRPLNLRRGYSFWGWSLLIGLAIGMGLVSKYTMVFIYPIMALMLLWPFPHRLPNQNIPQKMLSGLKAGMPQLTAIVIFSLPLLLSWLLFLYQSEVYQDQVSQISGYLGTEVDWSEDEMEVKEFHFFNSWRMKFLLEGVFGRIPAAFGLYMIPMIIMGLYAWIQDRKHSRQSFIWSHGFVLAWIAAVFIPVLITLPVDRYFMPAFPAIAILMAHGLLSSKLSPTRIVLLAVVLSISTAVLSF